MIGAPHTSFTTIFNGYTAAVASNAAFLLCSSMRALHAAKHGAVYFHLCLILILISVFFSFKLFNI